MEQSKTTAKYLKQMQRYSELNEKDEFEIVPVEEDEEERTEREEVEGEFLNRIKQFVCSPETRVALRGFHRELSYDSLPDLETGQMDSNKKNCQMALSHLASKEDFECFTVEDKNEQLASSPSEKKSKLTSVDASNTEDLPNLKPNDLCDIEIKYEKKCAVEIVDELKGKESSKEVKMPTDVEFDDMPKLIFCKKELQNFDQFLTYEAKYDYEVVYGDKERDCDLSVLKPSLECLDGDCQFVAEYALNAVQIKQESIEGTKENLPELDSFFVELDIPWKFPFMSLDTSEVNSAIEEKLLKFFQSTILEFEDGEEFELLLIQFLTVIPASRIPTRFIEDLLKYMSRLTLPTCQKISDVLMKMLNFNKSLTSSKLIWRLIKRNVRELLKSFQSDCVYDQRNFLILHYIVSTVAVSVQRMEIIRRKFILQKTLAWTLFFQNSHIVKISSWYGQALNLFLNSDARNVNKVYELMQGLQSLTTIALTVSQFPHDTADEISKELKKNYQELQNVEERFQFLRCLKCSDLVRYILVQNLLQDKFGFKETKPGVYPFDCQIIVENYIMKIDIETVDAGLEVILLIKFLLCDFCSSYKEQLHLPLHERSISGEQKLSEENCSALAVLGIYKSLLETNIQDLNPDLAAHPLCVELLSTLSFLSFAI